MIIGFYGKIGEAFGGQADVTIPADGLSVTGLRTLLAHTSDTDAILERSIRAAVNDEIVLDTHIIMPDDTVEFMSPVSGG